MTTYVLDSEALSRAVEDQPKATDRAWQATLAAILRDPQSEVVIPAAVLAEQYRGHRFDQRLDSFLGRCPTLRLAHTTRPLAKTIGHLLARAGLGSAHHVDATVAAVAVEELDSVILTEDPDDFDRLIGDRRAVSIRGTSS